jgi:L-rhamnose mutarotase
MVPPEPLRRAFAMTLKAGNEEEYARRHEAIWPELADAIRRSGVTRYSIFRHGLTLFAYQERDPSVPPPEPEPVMWRWWEYMKDLMETGPDARPVAVELPEVFRLDER